MVQVHLRPGTYIVLPLSSASPPPPPPPLPPGEDKLPLCDERGALLPPAVRLLEQIVFTLDLDMDGGLSNGDLQALLLWNMEYGIWNNNMDGALSNGDLQEGSCCRTIYHVTDQRPQRGQRRTWHQVTCPRRGRRQCRPHGAAQRIAAARLVDPHSWS